MMQRLTYPRILEVKKKLGWRKELGKDGTIGLVRSNLADQVTFRVIEGTDLCPQDCCLCP